MKSKRILLLPAIIACMALSPAALADAIYNVSIDTAPLIGNAAGPFSLDFQFTDGSGMNDSNNTVIVDNFNFGGGGVVGSAITTGSVTGGLTPSGFTMTDSFFLSELTQAFTPGTALDFTVHLTGNVDSGGVPDEFSFAIFDNTGSPIPTVGLFDTLLIADIDSSQPSLLGFASDPSRNAAGSGAPITLSAPVVTSPVPEPSALWWLGCGLLTLVLRRGR